ncbi:LANO_0D10924g1_1 [Lachancea nothofagi CBS 11611]|uniref:LANO_0D10924g1_1 n=1 Tax=Lachancea nothofagi CBS 11611 TaxID=1266666 RepID=A0A1G4JKR8_9SACH|nr:LANO_0D10924g1_1 [Lachancea nothofagi CBS 11611]
MLFHNVITLAVFAQQAVSHAVEKNRGPALNQDFSLPDLIQAKKLPKTWALGGQALLEEGRVVLTPKKATKGSVWSQNEYPLDNSFTAEWTIRSTNHQGKSEGGLAMWFVGAKGAVDTELYNGPSKFDGLQLLIDNNGALGGTLRAHLNDGNKQLTSSDVYGDTFASCLLAYQDSTVPLTVRLTYDSSDNHLLKVQVDNRVCFQTRMVKFPIQSYKFGITAENADNEESFELLEFELYDSVLEESLLPNVNVMEQPRFVTKVINQKTGEEELVEKTALEMNGGADSVSNLDLLLKLNRIEGKVLANDIGMLSKTIDELIQIQTLQSRKLDKVIALFASRKSSSGQDGEDSEVVDESFKEFFKMDEKLEKLLLEQQRIRDASKQNSFGENGGPHIDEIVRKLTIWLMPLVAVMMVMAYYTFKIRQEIVKTKLL